MEDFKKARQEWGICHFMVQAWKNTIRDLGFRRETKRPIRDEGFTICPRGRLTSPPQNIETPIRDGGFRKGPSGMSDLQFVPPGIAQFAKSLAVDDGFTLYPVKHDKIVKRVFTRGSPTCKNTRCGRGNLQMAVEWNSRNQQKHRILSLKVTILRNLCVKNGGFIIWLLGSAIC